MNKNSYFMTSLLALALAACETDVYNPEAVRPNRPLGADVVAPEGFDWKMTSETRLSVDVTDIYDAQYEYLIEVFPQNPDEHPDPVPMAAGYANAGQTYRTSIVLPDTYTEFYLRQTAPDGTRTVAALPFAGTDGTAYYKFEATQTKSGTDELRTASYPIEIEPTGKVPYTFCFEDQWPSYGDFDMNDIVIFVGKMSETGSDFRIEGDIRAVGESKKIGVGFRFRGINADDLEKIEAETQFTDGKRQTIQAESGHDGEVVFLLCDNAHTFNENAEGDYSFINTEPDSENNRKDVADYTIWLTFKDKDLRDEVYNINNVDFFIIIGTDGESKRTEVHIPGIAPTALGSTSLFGQGDDDSSAGDYYLSKDNLCWGFVVPAEFKWPVERANIKDVYPGFAGWVKSGGTSDTGWYDDTPAGDVYEQ